MRSWILMTTLTLCSPTTVAVAGDHGTPATKSSTLTLFRNDKRLIAVNRDSDSVTIFKISKNSGALKKQAEIPVGDDPRFVAVGGKKQTYAYVTNGADGTVSVIQLKGSNKNQVVDTIAVGKEPRGCAVTPNGELLYVANFNSGTVSVINTKKNKVIDTLPVGGNPWAIAVTSDGDADDSDEKVFVTQFYSEPVAFDSVEGLNDSRQGVVTVFPVAFNQFLVDAVVAPSASGFNADRSQFCTQINVNAHSDAFCPDPNVTDPNDPVVAQVPQDVFPNQLFDVMLLDRTAYVLSIGASPEPPVKFNVNVQALVSALDCDTLLEREDLFVNLNDQIKNEAQPADPTQSLDRLFGNDVVAMATDPATGDVLIVSRGGNLVVRSTPSGIGRLEFGAPTVTRFQTGNLPTGISIKQDGTRAYVYNEVDRSVTRIDLVNDEVMDHVESSDVPAPGSAEHRVAVGKLAFHTALGIPDNGVFGVDVRDIRPIEDRNKASDNGWSSCASCHADGLADSVTWYFATGPRQTIPLDAFFSKLDPTEQRISNWSAVRGSVTDFNNNARNVQGGTGFAGDPPPATIFNHGITEGASDSLDAMTDYVRTIRSLDMPDPTDLASLASGRTLFGQHCASCHGGAKWTKSTIVYQDNPAFDGNPLAGGQPIDPGIAAAGPQIVSFTFGSTITFLDDVGTFDVENPLELRGAGNVGQTALGGLGFNSPSMLSVGASAPFFHDGSARTLADVFDRHLIGVATIRELLAPQQLLDLELFVGSIDAETEIFPSEADVFLN